MKTIEQIILTVTPFINPQNSLWWHQIGMVMTLVGTLILIVCLYLKRREANASQHFQPIIRKAK